MNITRKRKQKKMPQNQTAHGEIDDNLYTAIHYLDENKLELFRYETLVCTYTNMNPEFLFGLKNFFKIPNERYKIIDEIIYEE